MNLFVTADIPAYECADPPLDQLWRDTVAEGDLVHVIVGADADLILPQLGGLPGRKNLVTGVRALDGGFVLSPLPLHPSQIAPGQINLSGKPVRPLAADPRRFCVSLALTGFRPIRLDHVRRLAPRARSRVARLPIEPVGEARQPKTSAFFQAAE